MREIPLTLQTTYAELVERTATASFDEAFAEDGVFVAKKIRGRRYWYFQTKTDGGRKQRYVGPETPELIERIQQHKKTRDDERVRRTLVSTLVRSVYLPRPNREIGDILAALSRAGVFRLRGVLIGTIAYQTYSAMLGTQLPAASVTTDDIDIAQFTDISVAVEDHTPPVFEILKQVDSSFRQVPNLHAPHMVTTYETGKRVRVDFLTPNKGRDTDAPAELEAFGTYAQQLRFLDFLIYDPEPAVVLHDAGVYVLVPAPQKYAVHKLIVSRRRREGSAKRNKDVLQAQALLEVLSHKRPHELRMAWEEAASHSRKWRQLLIEGLGQITPDVRDLTLKVIGEKRSIIPGLDLEFAAPVARYDFKRDIVTFAGEAQGELIRCAISRAALDDHFGTDKLGNDGRLKAFNENRELLEAIVRRKYLEWPVEDSDEVLIKSADVPLLRSRMKGK